jgi:hypothetical protein
MNATSVVMNSTTVVMNAINTTSSPEATTSKHDKMMEENQLALCVMIGLMCVSMGGYIIYANVKNDNTVKPNTNNDDKDDKDDKNDKVKMKKDHKKENTTRNQLTNVYVQASDIEQKNALPFVIPGNHEESDYISVKSVNSISNDNNGINDNQDANSDDYLLEDVVIGK